jgi:hypothetical protein
MKRLILAAPMLMLASAAALPLSAAAQTGFTLVISSAPPAPRYESLPSPRAGYVWAPGYWNWDGRRHHWQAGHWLAARPGYVYQPTVWVRDTHGYRLRSGYWQVHDTRHYGPPAYSGYRRDSDRDGLADRYDPYPYGRPAVRHHDRDGNRGSHYYHDGYRHQDGYRHHDGRRYGSGYHRSPDQDRDGVPDYRDRDRDGDGVSNRRDRDRDGDGVPNYYDGRPDNRWRN